jgi:squalene synthase HpnC
MTRTLTRANGHATEVELGDVYCGHLTRRHYENFWVASWLVSPAARRHLRRIYAFCRITDDLGDESGALAEERLGLWQQDVERCFEGVLPPSHPALAALADSVRVCQLPKAPFLDLIAANVQDQHVPRYETWDELHQYCLLSAAPVGRLVLRVFGLSSSELAALSDDVCIGLQLANFAQDVAVDREKGRAYVLQADVRRLGSAGAVRALCDRASDLLRSGRSLEARVSGGLRLQLALYRLGGEAILRSIAAMDYRTDVRPRLSTGKKLALVYSAGQQYLERHNHVGSHRAP